MNSKISNILANIAIIFAAILLAFNYHIFIIENNFAPAGLNGIATMIQYKTGFSISYMSLIINLPLCAISYFLVEKDYSMKTLLFTLVYSFTYLGLQYLELDFLKYNAQGHDTIFPAIISGVITGFVRFICVRTNSSTGGMDLVSKYINKLKPQTNFFMVTFILNAVVAVASLYVYSDKGFLDYKPVALCITYCFVSTYIGNYIIKDGKEAYKFTLITTHGDEICEEITHKLKHGATKVLAHGAYTNDEKTVLLCVVNKNQLVDFQEIISKYDNTFSFYEIVNETYGNFKKIKSK